MAIEEQMSSDRERTSLIRWLLLIHLYINRQVESFIKTCELIYAQAAKSCENVDNGKDDHSHDHKGEVDDGFKSLKVPLLMILQEKWTRLYYYVIIGKIVLPLEYLIELIWSPQTPAHCYLPGRFIIYNTLANQQEIEQMAKKIGLIFACWHLSWRILQQNSYLPLNMAMFMTQDPEKIETFYRLVVEQKLHPSLVGPQAAAMNLYLRQIMCYSVRYKTRMAYRVRSNRRPSAYRMLADRFIFATSVAVITLIILVSTVFPMLIYSSLKDSEYLNRYSGCNPKLQHLYNKGLLSDWSITLDTHHTFFVILDLVENFVLWIDSGFAVTIILTFAYLHNYDMLIVWNQLHKKLLQMDHILKSEWLTSQFNLTKKRALLKRPIGYIPSFTSFEYSPQIQDHYALISTGSVREKLTMVSSRVHELENRTIEIQAEIFDFFLQIEQIDTKFMSPFISYSVVVWFFMFMAISYHLTVLKEMDLYVPMLCAFGFLMFTIISLHLIMLHNHTKRSYSLICSIMAYDKTVFRAKYIRILEFFSNRNRSAYTLFLQWPYTRSSYLTVISWAISAAFIFESLWGKR